MSKRRLHIHELRAEALSISINYTIEPLCTLFTSKEPQKPVIPRDAFSTLAACALAQKKALSASAYGYQRPTRRKGVYLSVSRGRPHHQRYKRIC